MKYERIVWEGAEACQSVPEGDLGEPKWFFCFTIEKQRQKVSNTNSTFSAKIGDGFA
jgi:hypothetical protein